MGNQPGKLQNNAQGGRPKKVVTWKSAERPSPPGRPVLIPLSDQQPDVVNLHWERPKLDGGSPITGYVVEHRRMGSPHWVRATPTPVSRCEVSISGLEPGWRYQFRAFAENVVGRSDPSELSDPLTVTLQRNAISVPRFIDELQDTQAVEDERIEFKVRVVGQPPPEINWFKDGYEIFSSRRTKILNDNDVSVLIIHQVALTDEGEIKCTATNRAGHVVTKGSLQVQAPPKIRLPRTYEDGLIVEADEVLRLKVGIAGQPPPAVTWLHEGEVVPNSGRFEIANTDRNSMLKIDNIQRDDRGEYSIRAWNRLGEDVTSFLVTVTARPNPPGKVKLNMSFGRSATLSWTAPLDDGGCKIGNYIIEYFRVGWNVWLKATTTRSLSTTLHDLFEGSEYKFRVKAENPYGLSDPSEESDVLFIPDPKRGITKPKSESRLLEAKQAEEKSKAAPPRRKALSPQKLHQDAVTETKISPRASRKSKLQLIDTEDLHREMSYGTSDDVLKKDVRKSPSQSSADLAEQTAKTTLSQPTTKSIQRSPISLPKFLKSTPGKDKSPSPLMKKPSMVMPERTATPEITQSTLECKRSLSPVRPAAQMRKSTPRSRSPTPPESIKATPALQRSTEPVQLGVNQTVRRFSGHGLSPAKNAPSLAIAIATSGLGVGAFVTKEPKNGIEMSNGIKSVNDRKQNVSTITNPTIQISAPPPPIPLPAHPTSFTPSSPETPPSPSFTPSPTSPATTARPLPITPLSSIDKHDDVQTSNEFMLVVFDKNSKVKDKEKQDSFELDLEDAIQPPPISISSPDLASLEFTNMHTFPLRRSVSSTELLYERAMARFYEAVELEEAEKVRKVKAAPQKSSTPPSGNIQAPFVRKRLGSMTEAERLSFEKRSELRRQSADVVKTPRRWGSREDITMMKPLSRTKAEFFAKQQDSQESDDISDYQVLSAQNKTDSYDLGSDYTESTASSATIDSIEKFKMELMARTRSPSPPELETYHPRDMSAGVFTPYRAPTPEHAALVLNRPMPLPSPDFVPKPILKRQSTNNDQPSNQTSPHSESNNNGCNSNDKNNINVLSSTNTTTAMVTAAATSATNIGNEKTDIAKGIKSFFRRDKRAGVEKNTEENGTKINSGTTAIEMDAKRKFKEEEELKRKEAERIMQEEAHAAADHYSELVSQVSSTRKYHTPLYLDRDELQRAADRATKESIFDKDDKDLDMGLMPPISNKPRLSISERGQLIHVRETASNLAMAKPMEPETPSEDSMPQFSETSTVISEKTVERPDSRGRMRIVKVKRIIKKRTPSGTRSRDVSESRSPSEHPSTQDIAENTLENIASVRRRVTTRTQTTSHESKSPCPTYGRSSMLTDMTLPLPSQAFMESAIVAVESAVAMKSPEQLTEEATEKVRSALSYSTDLVLFMVACYVYLFKDARLVLPILALMIYRQLGEVIRECIPNWMRRKKN